MKYTIEDVRNWAEAYKMCLSCPTVGKLFNVHRTVVLRSLIKYKEKLNIAFKQEVFNKLNGAGKNYCLGCFEIKEFCCFPLRKDTNKYKDSCYECLNKRFKSRYAGDENFKIAHLDRSRAAKKRTRSKCNEYDKLWRKENKERFVQSALAYRQKNKERINLRRNEWRRNNKDKEANQKRNRRARALGVQENYSPLDRKITFEIFNNKCFKCGKENNLCVDHHYPLIGGNALTIVNAVVLCNCCNSSKYTKLPEEFYTKEELNTISMLFEKARITKGSQTNVIS